MKQTITAVNNRLHCNPEGLSTIIMGHNGQQKIIFIKNKSIMYCNILNSLVLPKKVYSMYNNNSSGHWKIASTSD